jgi:hypothetical protein
MAVSSFDDVVEPHPENVANYGGLRLCWRAAISGELIGHTGDEATLKPVETRGIGCAVRDNLLPGVAIDSCIDLGREYDCGAAMFRGFFRAALLATDLDPLVQNPSDFRLRE